MHREPAPDFCLPTLDGSTVCLRDYRGKVVLLSFWVTWCPSCQADLPQKEVFARSLRNPDFVFFTINVTGREAEPSQVPEFIRKKGYRFPVLLDKGRTVYDAYGIHSVPYTVLIGRDGTIVGRYDETARFTDIVKAIGKLLDATD